MRQTAANKSKGLHFEKMLCARAAASGMWAAKNELAFRYMRGGAIRPIRADLDFKVIRPDGRIAFVDCKAFAGDTFAYSAIDKNQLARACRYHQWSVPSGFVVWHERAELVVFYPGWIIAGGGPGKSFGKSQGRVLGHHLGFKTEGLFGPIN